MITPLITALRDNDIEPTAEELADALIFGGNTDKENINNERKYSTTNLSEKN